MTHVERVTDQHEGAYSLFQTAIMLEGAVCRARTEELTTLMNELESSNSALKAAKDEAEQANRSKTRFLAAASHDLLQPLNAARPVDLGPCRHAGGGERGQPDRRAGRPRPADDRGTSSRPCSTSPNSMPASSYPVGRDHRAPRVIRRSRREFRTERRDERASPFGALPPRSQRSRPMPACSSA